MDIQEIKVSELVPYANNPRVNDGAVEAVAKSIEEFGFKVPIVIDADNIIVNGHTRLKAAKKLGLKTVPCIRADDLSDEQIRAFRLVDNKVGEIATWDTDMLDAELLQLAGLEIDLGVFGFEIPKELTEDGFDADGAITNVMDPISKRGDIWVLGRHRLVCGDATGEKDLELLMQGYKAKLVITDPPYNVALGYNETPEQAAKRNRRTDGKKIQNDEMDDGDFRAFITEALLRAYEVMSQGAPIYVFHADSEGYKFRGAFQDAGLKLAQCLIWVKNALIMGRSDYQWRHEPILYGWKQGAAHFWHGARDKDTVFDDHQITLSRVKKPELVQMIKDLQCKLYDGSTIIYHDKPGTSAEHPTMKPIKLIGRLIYNSSSAGDLILDSFGGSGSTLIAAEQTDRICYMMELDPTYCDVIVQRFRDFTQDSEPIRLIRDGMEEDLMLL